MPKDFGKTSGSLTFGYSFPKEGNYIFFETLATNYRNTKKTQVNMPYFGYLLNFLNANLTSFELLKFQNISKSALRPFTACSSSGKAQVRSLKWSGLSLGS
ncbi:hypothetical protein [Helicobacter felis]|uniref:hypothetical protein n=1 Tax=Helicobacter felis TaxID=214 RepID=UPI001315A214|nr:hypothetical protein [Helicobacter felis]